MKLVTFSPKGSGTRVGEVQGDTVYRTSWPDPMHEIVKRGIMPSVTSEHYPLDEVKLEAPIHPGKIMAIGRNYAEHAEELKNEVPEKPLIFAKYSSSVIGMGDTIEWDASITQQVDWEGELAVIIGKRARHVSEKNAYRHIFGYTIGVDVTARDVQSAESQWTRAKSLDTFCPMGPLIVTRKEIDDPHALSIKTTVNGEVMQDGNTKDMVFKIPFLVAYLSQMFTLEPGDVILTGTPSGVGKGMEPPRFLQDGDELSVTIEGIGTLTNPCKIRA